MTKEKSKWGLGRTIPEAVKREVRQDSFFGCIFCGGLVYNYEHVDPEFKDACEHNPENMTLLCGIHHDLKTGGQLSAERIKAQMLSPYNQNKDALSASVNTIYPDKEITVALGSTLWQNTRSILSINGQSLFSIISTELYPLINFEMYNAAGSKIIDIQNNEVFLARGSYDIVSQGSEVRILNKARDIALWYSYDAKNKLFQIKRFNCVFANVHVFGDEEKGLVIEALPRTSPRIVSYFETLTGGNLDSAIEIRNGNLMIGRGGVKNNYFSITGQCNVPITKKYSLQTLVRYFKEGRL